MPPPPLQARADIDTCAALCDYYAEVAPRALAEQPLDGDVDGAGAGVSARVVHEPRGVVGLITPWNYPLMQACHRVP